MNTKTLENIGLTRNQAEVYVTLLKLGSATAQQIIKESGIQRSPVYDALEKLRDKGLVSFVTKDFKKYFQAESPKALYGYLEEKKEEISQIMPQLEALEGMKKENINASIYKGKEGLKTIHYDMLKEGKQIDVIGGKGLIFSELKYYIPHWEKERIKKKMKWRILWDNKKIRDEVIKRKYVDGKVLPKGTETSSVVNIYGNKVAIFLWKEKYPTAFVIDNKDVADSFRKWFNLLYDKI
ncbi:MAG: TrmB family transcriptional regulator [Candidatus Woesearchaeota archaeon]